MVIAALSMTVPPRFQRHQAMSATPPLPRVSTQLAAAREHLKLGRLREAEQAYRQVLVENPALPEALRFLANAALSRDQPGEAVELLSRALESNRNDPDMLIELGVAYRAGERPDAARFVLERAVELGGNKRPSARLLLANVLEADERHDLALLHYFRAIIDAQGMGQWLDDDTTEPGIRGLVKYAMGYVAQGRRDLFDRALAPLREQAGDTALERVDRAMAIYLREAPLAIADPRQRPTFLYVPSLGTGPFLDGAMLPWLEESAARIAALGDQADACAKDGAATAPTAFSLGNLLGESQAGPASADVPRRIPVYQRGNLSESAKTHAPRLVAALDDTPLVRIPWHGPDAEILRLAAGERLAPAYGRTNSRVSVIVVLSDSTEFALEVGGECMMLRPSQSCVFDSTFGYACANRSDRPARAVMFEVWHPALAPLEQRAIEAVTGAAVEFDSRLYELP